MQINKINAGQHFTGRRENIDAYIGLDDQTIRQVATLKTLKRVDTKKHERLDRALDAALPVAGGISAAAYAEKGARMAAFGSGFGTWAFFLAGMGAAFGIEKAVRKKSEKVDNFAQKHPFMTFVASAGAAFAAGMLAIKGGAKGLEALSKTNAYQTVSKKAGELIGKIKAKPIIANTAEKVSKFLAKTPPALKEVGKFTAKNATWLTIFGSIFHSVNHRSKVANEYAKNYTEMKERQLDLAKRRNIELSMQNDLLMTDPKNREVVKTVEALKKGPIEV